MIQKERLLLDASKYNDSERFSRLLEYDSQQNGLMLYRYRHIDEKTPYEIDALATCRIWASNPRLFDDKFEFLPSSHSPKDMKCVRYFLEREVKKMPAGKERNRTLAQIEQFHKHNPKQLIAWFLSALEEERRKFAVSCFTENAPVDLDNNMWHQYAKDSGICLGYSLTKIVDSRVLIDPVYYVDEGEKSLGNMFELFGCNEYAVLNFCIKDKYGVDKYSGSSEKICWAEQNEWRYGIENVLDATGKDYANGCYLERKIVPDVVYIKNLSFRLRWKVWKAAKKNGIKVVRLS